MRWILSAIVFIFTTLLLIGGGAFLWSYQQYIQEGPLQSPALFTVKKGQGVPAIADQLAAENIISEPLIFRGVARITGADKQIKAGEYRFAAGVPMADVLEKLESGDIYMRQITVPEGLTSWQVVQLLNKTEHLTGDITDIPEEGTLLPETYRYIRGESRQDKIAQMQKAMKKTLNDLYRHKPKNAPVLNKGEVVILASIVEKETAVPEERRRIAGVFINRLKKGIRLQTDPSVIYAITEGKIEDKGQGQLGRRLLTRDLQFESPYNTYKYPGLPPGPIANPGKAAIEAVLNPEEHDYYYFVADGTGGHVFSKTLEEHNRNVAKWRKIRAQQN